MGRFAVLWPHLGCCGQVIASRAIAAKPHASTLFGLAMGLVAATVRAEILIAEPTSPIEVSAPDGAASIDVQITLQVVVDTAGNVESVVEMSHSPSNISQDYLEAAIRAVKAAKFRPSTKDGQPIRYLGSSCCL